MKIAIDLKSGLPISEETTPAQDLEERKEVIVGIDLGTTNSLVAYMKEGLPVAVRDQVGGYTLVPSVIHFTEGGEIMVGDAARKHLITAPERTIFSVKRLMGKSYRDVASIRHNLGYDIIDDETSSLVKIRVGNTFHNPVGLSAEILRSLKQRAEAALACAVQKAVITVPAYFNDTQRQATRDAGKLAGLDVLRIINEPTAASLAYGLGLDREQSLNIAVYDLGGGTFDVSVLHLEDGIFEVLSTHGDTFLGGDDIDRMIAEAWAREHGWSDDRLIADRSLSQTLRLAAEEAKKNLSTADTFTVEVAGVACGLRKDEFNQLIEPLVQKTLDCCRQALADAGCKESDIDKVILVGGSTRIPRIKEALTSFFGKTPDDSVHPDEAVALGAAIQADILAGNRRDILLLDVTPLSLGIETVGGLMDTIIPRNSKVPHRAGRQYTTSVDGQTNLRVSVYQGERDLVEHNRKLGEFLLRNIPPMAAGMPKIEVHFILDADGILTVRAKELRSGVETSVDIQSAYGISEEEMAQMLLDSLHHASEDVKVRARLEAVVEAKTVLLATEKFIHQHARVFTTDELDGLRTLAGALREAAEQGEKDDIEMAMQALNHYSAPMAQRALDDTISQSLRGTHLDQALP